MEEVLGLRGSVVKVVDPVGGTWNGRAVRVVNESKTSELIGLLFVAGSSPALSTGSVVHFKSDRFLIHDAGDIRGVTVRPYQPNNLERSNQ